ncbi:hypothetical protein DB41_JG00020 [Neochlamydia sp. TUME1]|nr:hypothetical protein DB41_JG00020 [Neochlamydia sp. TUME1]
MALFKVYKKTAPFFYLHRGYHQSLNNLFYFLAHLLCKAPQLAREWLFAISEKKLKNLLILP